jgi:glycosyltransferase involved in cell wall biosynthesis
VGIKVGYVMQKYPSLTLTFVYREVLALRAAGFEVETFSIWKPRRDELSSEARALVDETFYLFPLRLTLFAGSHLRYLLTRPRRYLSALAFCAMRDWAGGLQLLRRLSHFLQAGYLAAEVERRGIRHLHAHFARNATTLAMVVARLCDTTFSFTAHANDLFVAPTLLPQKLQAAHFVVAISEYNRHFLQRCLPGPETQRKLHVVRYGLDTSHFARLAPPATDAPPLILSIGRLVEKKGFPYLVQACQHLSERGYRFRCVIVGQGPEEAKLRRMIASAGLAAHVQLAGAVFQEKLTHYLADAQVFALPCVVATDGDRDGIPNTLIEAMAMELATVSTEVVGIPELIEHEKSGLLVAPHDSLGLANALARLLDDEALRYALGKAGRAKVVAEYEIGKNTHELLSIFQCTLLDPEAAQTTPGGSAISEALG